VDSDDADATAVNCPTWKCSPQQTDRQTGSVQDRQTDRQTDGRVWSQFP
jgi:hypothetical protein